MSKATDTHRVAKAHTPLGGKLVFREIQGREELSRLFEYRVELLAEEDSTVDPKALLGQGITIEIEIQGGGSRYIDAQCNRFAYIGHETAEMRNTKFYRYEARLVPWTWYMTLASNSRVFQNRAVPDIIREIFESYPGSVDYRLSRSYREWEYCVQYHETDFNFVSRLMEHEGIGFFFEHAMGAHKLVLFDDVGALSPLPGYASIPHLFTDKMVVPDEEWIDHWRMAQEVDTGRYVTDDFDFKYPQPHLRTTRSNEGSYSNSGYEIYDWPGGYVKVPHGEQYARVRLEELQQTKELVSGQSDVRGLTPGYLFSLTRCPRRDQNREYLILGVTCFLRDNPYHSGVGAPSDWQFTLFAQPSTLPYRPVRRTTKPRTMGPQTAVVVGLKSNRDEEIVCDEHGRVRVQFHWDRYHGYDEDSSCWIRVASNWAGSNWGQISIPRVGQEVIVDFIDGDPDYPIITGRVYNGEHKPPYELPRWKEYSTWKSRSTKKGGNYDFNEVRFYDYKGKEQVFIHAQRRMDVRVKWNKYETVKEASHFLMGSCYFTSGSTLDLHTKTVIYARADGKVDLGVGGNLTMGIDGELAAVIKGKTEVNARSITLEALTSITLKVGANFVKIDPSGITIQGSMTRINSGGGAAGTANTSIDDPNDAAPADTGEPGYLDRVGSGGGGGGRKKRQLNGQHAPPFSVTTMPNGDLKLGNGLTVKKDPKDPTFQDKALRDLTTIASTERGSATLNKIDQSGKPVTIAPQDDKHKFNQCAPDNYKDGSPAGKTYFRDSDGNKVEYDGTGKGTGSTVYWKPDDGKKMEGGQDRPSDVSLHHELGHASHNATGTASNEDPAPPDDKIADNKEEVQNIKEDNDYRTERNLPTRRDHGHL